MNLFKHLSFVIVLIFATQSASAQWSFGPKIALNMSSFTEDVQKAHFDPGFDIGLFARSGGRVYFQPEIMYSLHSNNISDAIEELQENFQVVNHYISIPLDMGCNIVNKEKFKFRVIVGTQLGFLINSNTDQSIQDLFSTLTYGGEAGLGFDIYRFTVDVKYAYIGCQSKSKEVDSWDQHVLSVALGFKFSK